MKLFLVSGKARHGKNTVSSMIREYYENKGLKVLETAFAKYIRMYAKELTSWDGCEDTKPRTLMQELGTDIIRKKLGKDDFFVRRMVEDIEIYQEFVDVVIITDVRFPIEIDYVKKYYKDAIVINVKRINFNTNLTEEQQKHASEIALDNYTEFDYILTNDTLEELKNDVNNMLDNIN